MKFLPEKKEWIQLVEKALNHIRKGLFEKVVLARCTILEGAFNPFAIAAHLPALGAKRFCFTQGNKAFLGATPELLFSRKRDQLCLVAMAGTRPRGKTPDADCALAQELLNSPKDLHEWSYIPRHFQQLLGPSAVFPAPTIYQTPNVQHLYAAATLTAPMSDAALLERLHPTPAICGFPQRDAAAFIREHEPFDRGLFGTPIGWSTPDAAEYHIAIRSCTIEDTTMRIYTAAGIVKDSNPEAEWEELNAKLQLFQGIFP